ncbi:MAG TPA: 50S ribosomal protein L10 [Thermodesulfobacteriota bacterium]|nr:50S ribosomal protein L10 [Thermodesulfobacteriota bacterium]
MKKTEKEKYVEDLKDKLTRADAMFLAEYRGIKAAQMNEFRRTLRDAKVELKVVRNTLARRALGGTASEHLREHLNGPVAFAFSYQDAALAAKRLTEFAKDQPAFIFRVGTLGEKVLAVDDIKRLAELPPKDVLLGKLLASMKSPVSGLVGVLSGVPRKLLYALNAIGQQKAQ